MGILDWFKNRPSQFDPDRLSDEMLQKAIDKAVTLTNPRLKLVRSYQERLAPVVQNSLDFLRDTILALPPPLWVSFANWSFTPALRAFFVAATDISGTLGRSTNLRTLFAKYPEQDDAYFILGMTYIEQNVLGVAMQGDVLRHDVSQTVVSFSDHKVRICGRTEAEIRRLLGAQGFEYLVAQALAEIGEERSERLELQDTRALIRARLRMLQQQGPGLGSVFAMAPGKGEEQLKLEERLLENERQLEALGSAEEALDGELEALCGVLAQPEKYVHLERKQLKLNSMNVVLDDTSTDIVSEIDFSLAQLSGAAKIQSAFVLARMDRSEMPEIRMNLADAERYL